MFRTAILTAAMLLPVPATAQSPEPEALLGRDGLYVSNTEICPMLGDGEALVPAMSDTGALALGPQGIEGVEYHCAFEPALDLTAPEGTITTHLGYCEEPGLITPQLFTFRIETLESPRAVLYDGSEQPMTFFACPG
ncbi:hypothetical protein [Pararhodobacter sp. CCB-MM2]|uniref:hypothetical protein n=1 Tax=Pararhodobacter sp. CCB-MM2 TaxID=1786003 RepID=UPI001111B81E|nr:hypothetical protein [Pararhodobacter sp. CCB-MM2]